jgi:HEAT repeats
MPSLNKRWLAAGAIAVAALAAAAVLVGHRHARRPAEADEAVDPGFAGFAAGRPGASPSQGSGVEALPNPEELAKQVTTAMQAWRGAVLNKDPETVVSLDRAFRENPPRFMDALTKSAESDDNERVRAFSTRVLGKLRKPELADLFGRLMADKSPYVRQNAAWALGELASATEGRTAAQRSLAELRRARARDPAGDVRSAAKGALERLE